MNDPSSTPRRRIDTAAWAEYEAGNLYARLAYEIEHHDSPMCARCNTRRRDGSNRLCWRCRKDKK